MSPPLKERLRKVSLIFAWVSLDSIPSSSLNLRLSVVVERHCSLMVSLWCPSQKVTYGDSVRGKAMPMVFSPTVGLILVSWRQSWLQNLVNTRKMEFHPHRGSHSPSRQCSTASTVLIELMRTAMVRLCGAWRLLEQSLECSFSVCSYPSCGACANISLKVTCPTRSVESSEWCVLSLNTQIFQPPYMFLQMVASGIVALFSGLSAASSGAHGSLDGMLAMLSAMRWVHSHDPHSCRWFWIPT